MKVLVISKDGVTLPLLMARGERPTMRGFDTGERSRQRKRICGRMPPTPPTPPPAQNVSQRSVTNIDLDPKCRLFCLLSGGTKRDQKCGRSSGFLRIEGEDAGTIPSGHSPQAGWRGEWGRAEVGKGNLGLPLLLQGYTGIQQPEEAPARQFTELPRPCCKFLVRRP